MDQNNPQNEASGASSGGDTSAWNQAPQPDQPQQAGDGSQDAQAEYAAWSADSTYQQGAGQPAANPADTQAYATPEQQQYQQPQPGYDQQAYQQQQYQQPQPGYDQQAYQQQQYQQQYYDQQGYQQQQQPQPQQPQPQPQQPQPQPQYYDQSAYGQQQPGYYDQSAYNQQGYQQQGYPPQGAPYAYAQPGQDSYYTEGEGGYNRSFLAVLAGWVLMTWGFVWGAVGAVVLVFQNQVFDWVRDQLTLSADVTDAMTQVEAEEERIFALGGILLIIGIIHIIGAIGIFGHRRWGRAFGIVLGLLGILAALGIFTISAGFEAMDVGLTDAVKGEESSVAASLFVLACYGLVFIGMITGRRHFKKKGVQA